MGDGMAEFIVKDVVSIADYDKYCHYVAGALSIRKLCAAWLPRGTSVIFMGVPASAGPLPGHLCLVALDQSTIAMVNQELSHLSRGGGLVALDWSVL